jgi:hypothetical protein
MGAAGIVIAAIVFFALGAAAGAGFLYYRQNANGESPRFFAPRSRRLAFVERTALESGRKLMLVRRDEVEHLILVGGPIDLVVETGIRAEGAASVPAKEEGIASVGAPGLAVAPDLPLDKRAPALEIVALAEPALPLSPRAHAEESLSAPEAPHEAKAAE